MTTSCERYHAAACQTAFDCPTDRVQIADRTRRMCEMVERTVTGYEPFFDVRLLAFPEFAHAAPVHGSVGELRRRLGVPVPNEHVDTYERTCRRLGCYVQTGTFLEVHPDHPDVVFNTSCLVGPEGVLATYRKVNPWIPWELHASPHDVAEPPGDPFPVADTPIGRIGCAICYDWLFPETIRELRFRGAEVLVRVSAYMDPWGATPPMDWWTLFNRARAAENACYVVAANQGAGMEQYPPFSWPGGSMVVDFEGRVSAQADPGPGEKVVVAPIDLAALRHARERRRGHDTIAHHRAELHRRAERPAFPPAAEHPITAASVAARIDEGRRRTADAAGAPGASPEPRTSVAPGEPEGAPPPERNGRADRASAAAQGALPS